MTQLGQPLLGLVDQRAQLSPLEGDTARGEGHSGLGLFYGRDFTGLDPFSDGRAHLFGQTYQSLLCREALLGA